MYPFTGIRGDSKELWGSIKRGQLKQAELVRADTVEEQRQILSKADIVILAVGYQSNTIPIIDVAGQQINLATTSVPIRDQNISVVGDVIKTGP